MKPQVFALVALQVTLVCLLVDGAPIVSNTTESFDHGFVVEILQDETTTPASPTTTVPSAPVPRNWTAYLMMEEVEKCVYIEEILDILDANNLCIELVDNSYPSSHPDISNELLRYLRQLYLNYDKRLQQEPAVWEKCYYEHGNYKQCKRIIRNELEGMAITKRSLKRLDDMWQSYRDQDEELVWHCFEFHQTVHIEPCRGISWDRKKWDRNVTELTDRDKWMKECWESFTKEIFECMQVNEAKNKTDFVWMDRCLYLPEQWRDNPNDTCWLIVADHLAPGADARYPDKKQLVHLRAMFEDQWNLNRVNDCDQHHRIDRDINCYEISWSLDSVDQNNVTHVHTDPLIASLRERIAKVKRTNRGLPDHHAY